MGISVVKASLNHYGKIKMKIFGCSGS